ncbi:glycosyltransferase family 4 protein [Streptomyces fructofermentans]|uniref:glycosyltransferase family 4 protein n=1 Tax=Streptomyces fructofermentans TaxID=152141 RepID=UPI003401A0D2
MKRTGRKERTGTAQRTGRKKIVFLLHNAYAVGATVRTTLDLAAALAERHDVEIVSARRHRDEPRFAVDPRVALVPLVDVRDGSADLTRPEHSLPALDLPACETRYEQYSRLTDLRARAYLSGCAADVVIGTRPGLNVYVSRFAPRRSLRIAQERLRLDARGRRLLRMPAARYRSLDAVVTTTEADARAYREGVPLPGVRVAAVPDVVPAAGGPPGGARPNVIAAAGRLVPGKRFDLLIEAFSAVASKEPDWQLRIYGGGPGREHLQQLIDGLGLSRHARLMGPRTPMGAEFAKSAMVVCASDAEASGTTLVEAMRCGVPVISTDCPLGPGEIVTDGVDGLLVPVGDARSLADAMLDLIADGPLRRTMGAAALESSRRFDPGPIADRYEDLFAELAATGGRRALARAAGRVTSLARRGAGVVRHRARECVVRPRPARTARLDLPEGSEAG